jgi:hypothetical protein
MNEKLMDALGELFIEGSPLYNDAKGLMELAIKEERERCAAYVEKNVITSGIHIGPLFNAGWAECCARTAEGLRDL